MTYSVRMSTRLMRLVMVGLASAGFVIADANAAPPQAAAFGLGQPGDITELPPGLLRSNLENLPPAAKARALRWLQGFEFPAADAAQLRVDARGGIFYEDPTIEQAGTVDATATPGIEQVDASSVFLLHSKPGASRTVYLDMDGHTVSGTVWNANAGVDPLIMKPYDTDGNPASFSQTEVNAIADVWKRIAEDFAAFDIDVTTEQPASFGPNVGHILVTRKADQNGNPIYTCSCGGVAYVGVWGNSNYPYYQPALVFQDGVNSVHTIAEAASHELGHNLGLSHDGTSTTGYYLGHGSGNTSWAPIMGAGYYTNVTQWSRGEYADANNTQDDLAIIAGRLSYRSDDHEDIVLANATPLVRSGTTIASTTPVSDPDNVFSHNKGVIEDSSDIDLFYIDSGAGVIDLSVVPDWRERYASSNLRGSNLDVLASLYDGGGNLIAQSNPIGETDASVSVSVAAGRYYLAVAGVGEGDPATGYSSYGSLGQYTISGSVPEDVVATEPPSAPTDLTASLVGENGIALVWTDPASTATTNEAGYRVMRQVDGGLFAQVGTVAKDGSSFSDNNLASGTYVYQVEAYNSAGSAWSNLSEAVTISLPSRFHATSETTVDGTVSAGSYVDTTVVAGSEQLTETHQGGRPNSRVSSLDHRWNITGVQPGALMTLSVIANAPANSEGDDFSFAWSADGSTFTTFGVLDNGTGEQTLSTTLPATTSGTVIVRVQDTDRTTGNGNTDSVSVSLVRIESQGQPGEQMPVLTVSEPTDGAVVLQGEPVVLSASADDYEDGDLSSDISWSSSLDGFIGSGPNLAVTTLSLGDHLITATVTDSASNTVSETVSVTITDQAVASTVRVADLQTGVSADKGQRWTAIVYVQLVDDLGNPVANATLSGNWGDGANGSASCTSDANGQCAVGKPSLKNTVPSVSFTVSTVTHATLGFDGSGASSVIVTSPY